MNAPAQPASIVGIFLAFFRIGLLSFGGGVSGWVFRDVVQQRRWLAEDEFLSGLAVAQILPGTNISNLAVYIGHRLKGRRGAAVALIGLLLGPFFAVIGLASAYNILTAMPFTETALGGVAVAAIGLSFIVAARGLRRAARRPEALIALVIIFVTVGLLHWSLLAMVIVIGPLSVMAAWLRARANA